MLEIGVNRREEIMKRQIRILHLEAKKNDADLIQFTIKEAGFTPPNKGCSN